MQSRKALAAIVSGNQVLMFYIEFPTVVWKMQLGTDMYIKYALVH